MKDIFRTIKWYVKFMGRFQLSWGQLKKANKLKETSPDQFEDYTFKLMRDYCLARIKDSGSTVDVFGEENLPEGRNVLFVCNHQGDFDIPILVGAVPRNKRFIVKIELSKIRIIKGWLDCIDCLFIDRNDMKQSLKIILQAIDLLKNGKDVVIFPEGTRSRSSELGEFKQGSFKLAIKSNVPIVPITMDGSYKIKEMNNNKIKPAHVQVYIHEPIYTENLSKEEKNQLHVTVREVINNKLQEIKTN
ncbi:MAG: lysophospholipid acyltransferase family protein [bacterium]